MYRLLVAETDRRTTLSFRLGHSRFFDPNSHANEQNKNKTAPGVEHIARMLFPKAALKHDVNNLARGLAAVGFGELCGYVKRKLQGKKTR